MKIGMKPLDLKPEDLHNWYLEATKELNPESYNPNAQKPYDELTDEQKFIDKFVCSRLKHRIKSACEFWLKYCNIEGLKELYANRLWMKVNIHLDKKEKEKLKEFYMNLFDFEGDYVKLRILEYEYNDWLFRLVFKDVLEDEK